MNQNNAQQQHRVQGVPADMPFAVASDLERDLAVSRNQRQPTNQ